MDFSTKIIEWVFSGVLTAIGLCVRYLWKKVGDLNDKMEANNNATRIHLKFKLNDYYKEYFVDKKYMPVYVKEMVTEAFENYTTLGGNGIMKRMYEEMMDLPAFKPKRERKSKVK